MIRLNGKEYAYRPGMSLKELVDDYNSASGKLLAFDGFAVIINGSALAASQAQERTLLDNDKIFIVPLLDGG
jgi:sulfur carrier protein ThiS